MIAGRRDSRLPSQYRSERLWSQDRVLTTDASLRDGIIGRYGTSRTLAGEVRSCQHRAED